MRTVAVAFLLLGSFSFSGPLFAATFAADEPIESNTGYALLEWEADGPVTLEMAEAPDFADARPIYRGDFQSYFVSGLRDGDYHYRLRDDAGTLSAPVTVQVAHQSLTQAIWLMIAGALATIGIAAAIWRGARDE